MRCAGRCRDSDWNDVSKRRRLLCDRARRSMICEKNVTSGSIKKIIVSIKESCGIVLKVIILSLDCKIRRELRFA